MAFLLNIWSVKIMIKQAIFAGGCFWGMEARYQTLPGVLDTEVGYTGGHLEEPTYRDVCQDDTGHVEAVRIEFDPAQVSYRQILEAFFTFHDATLCRDNCRSQSSQYRSVIFPLNGEQQQIAESVLFKAKQENKSECRIVTAILPASTFYEAEKYHQDYYKKHNLMISDELRC